MSVNVQVPHVVTLVAEVVVERGLAPDLVGDAILELSSQAHVVNLGAIEQIATHGHLPLLRHSRATAQNSNNHQNKKFLHNFI